MAVLTVQGGIPLKGKVTVSGSKHTALVVLGALPLLRGNIKVNNIPEIRDVEHMLRINESLGVVTCKLSRNEYKFALDHITYTDAEMWRVSQLRSSILYLGSILVSQGHVALPFPGGDNLGARPVEEFLYVLNNFGIRHQYNNDVITATLSCLIGNRKFDLCSEKFTLMGNNRSAIAIMLAYANKGVTKMKNVLVLPEIVHLCEFLQLISGNFIDIRGIGTDTLVIDSPGLDALHSRQLSDQHYIISADKCEVPFWISAAALTGGDITCHVSGVGVDEQMRRMDRALLQRARIPLEIVDPNQFRINCSEPGYRPTAFHLLSTQHELEGIAFDACPILATMLLKARGKGSFYCYRYGFHRVKWFLQLDKIGAKVHVENNVLLTEGCSKLYANESHMLWGYDIRGASGVLLAVIATEGEQLYVRGVEHIDRGVENIVSKLRMLGAMITPVGEGVLV